MLKKIDSFDVGIVAHKNGLMDVMEVINYDFENLSKHGIYRYISLYSKVGNLYRIIKIDNVSIERDGQPEKFDEVTNRDQINIIKPDYNPNWYVGYPGNFYLAYGSFASFVIGSNLTTSAPSSSSGSSGGFSGGGGGGGGSW